MKRIHQAVLIGSVLYLSWLGMMAVHEFGHVVGARLTGGKVTHVVLHPLAISRTDVSPNPDPHVVVWAGPVIGILLPVLGLIVGRWVHLPGAYLIQFFCGFCLIANGVYIGVGSFQGIGDAGDMLRSGSSLWQLWAFGLVTVPIGIWLWNGLGPNFGFGDNSVEVNTSTAYCTLILLLIVIGFELAWFD